jgi:flagellar motor component MotA
MVRFIVSLGLLLATISGAVLYERGNLLAYVGISTLMVELLVPVFAGLAVWRLAEIGRAFGDAFSKKADSPSRSRSARIWEFAEKVCYATGVIGFILGVVLTLAWVSGSINDLARAFAASLTAPLYGVLFGVVCRILKARVER